MEPSLENLPEKVRKRLQLYNMFYPLERTPERRWARLFSSSFETICEGMVEKAEEYKYLQEAKKDEHLLWRDPDEKNVECMFYFFPDATSFDRLFELVQHIHDYNTPLTYVIVHQKKDGQGVYDIFRLSKFSWLEHCNRVRVPKRKK